MSAEPSARTALPAAEATPLTRLTTLVMAAAAGLAVANIYYNQPLIGLLLREFPGSGLVGFVPTATQVGYAAGIVLLVPLGDRVERRALIVGQMLALSVALAGAALAPSGPVLLMASLLIGLLATVPQQIVPFAADLAAPEERGAAIGTVMSGLLCGILLARTVSGGIGDAFGWRAVFAAGIAVALGTAAVLAAMLPRHPPKSRLSYPALLASTAALVREEPRLRRATLVQTCLFAGFSAFWTVLALRLEGEPYHLGANVAGLFGLVGVAGALAAPVAGRIADRFGPRAGILAGIGAVALCWLVLSGTKGLAGMVLGVLLLDAGVQGAMIGNQHVIFALRPEARNRVNTVYMGTLFAGGAAGSALSVVAWRHGGWGLVCALGGAATLAALVLQLLPVGGAAKPPAP